MVHLPNGNTFHCSYLICQLLKEHGLALGTHASYTYYLKTQQSDNPSFRMKKDELEYDSSFIMNNGPGDMSNENYHMCERVTIQEAIEWLSDYKDRRVVVLPAMDSGYRLPLRKYSVMIYTYVNGGTPKAEPLKKNRKEATFVSPQAAAEAGLLHVLENLSR